MVNRKYWIDLIEKAWRRRSVIWLAGVRRSGKTCLCQSLQNVEYFDCELPRTRRLMEDPEGFLNEFKGRRIVLDEVHRLTNPSELLKIGADHYQDTSIIATGSSSLGASIKFKDTLTGRKETIWLTPMTADDMVSFGETRLEERMQRGGLPPFFIGESAGERDYQEWMDAFWSKDIQELFRLERKTSFQKFLELVMIQSGGIFEATSFAQPCEISRTTVSNYLSVLEASYTAHVVRPFNTHKATEIVAAPKVYAFDTGFVCCYRGWDRLRSEDMGILWEHYVLNEIQARLQVRSLLYWRNKQKAEIDFIWLDRKKNPVVIECKRSADQFDAAPLRSFRHQYPDGANFAVCRDVDRSYSRTFGDHKVFFVSLESLIKQLQELIDA